MKHGVRLLGLPLQHLDCFCRREHHQFDAAVPGLTFHIVHDGQTSICSGTDDQTPAVPRNLFFQRQRCVAKLLAELLGWLFLPSMDLASIGKRFDADYVIYIEIDPHSLDLYEKGYGCYRGVADTTITLVDVNDPDEGPMPKEMCFQYPGEGKIAPEVNEIRPVQFRQMFAGYMAKKIAWCFVTHTVKAGYHQEIDAGQGEQTMQLR